MDDCFERTPCVHIGKHNRPELVPIHGARAVQHIATEPFGNLTGGLSTGGRNAMGELVSIEAGHASFAEFLEHVTLASRDAAGKCNFTHAIQPLTLRARYDRWTALPDVRLSQSGMRRSNGVLEQHRDRQRSDATGDGAQST